MPPSRHRCETLRVTVKGIEFAHPLTMFLAQSGSNRRFPQDSEVISGELQRLRLAVEASGEIIFMTDVCGTFVYVNPEFVRVYGYQPSDVVGCATPRILKGGTTIPEEYASFWRGLKQKQTLRRDFLNRTKAGALLHIECSVNPIVDHAGTVVGFLAVQRDVTARKQVEDALRESERRYRTLAEAAHDSIFIVNWAAEIEYANGISAARFGRLPSEIIGKRLDEVFPPATAAAMGRELATVFETGVRQMFESRFESPSGDLWLETSLVPLQGDDAKIRAVIGVSRDVTERKRLERQFLQAQKMEAVGRLAGGIAHDFNNMLTAILGFSELVQYRVDDRPEVLADVAEIRKAGERASLLTRQLLAFSRKQPMAREVLDVGAVLADLRKMIGRIVGEDIELSVVTAPDVWQVVADPGQIEQVLMNLVVNARDALPKGGRLTITAENADLDKGFAHRHAGAAPGPYVSITVQDSGCGMSADTLAHVFEPFFTTKPVSHGTGLGLSTVYGIVKQNSGYVDIQSQLGMGTTVTVFWPRRDDRQIAPLSRTDAPPRALSGTETILLVEDDAGIRGLMRRTLEPYGYRVLESEDVSDALAIAAAHEHEIHLLLSDVIMPGLNGPDVAQRIVAHRPDIKILYVSGFPDSLLSEQDQTRRRVRFLAKPFTPQALANKVRECLDAPRE
jgi:two-component system cell cycle sensor histidine kinase/response regulator CckA